MLKRRGVSIVSRPYGCDITAVAVLVRHHRGRGSCTFSFRRPPARRGEGPLDQLRAEASAGSAVSGGGGCTGAVCSFDGRCLRLGRGLCAAIQMYDRFFCFACLSVYIPLCLSVCRSVCPSVGRSVRLSLWRSVWSGYNIIMSIGTFQICLDRLFCIVSFL